MGLLLGGLYLLWYFARSRCSNCGRRGTLKQTNREVLRQWMGQKIKTLTKTHRGSRSTSTTVWERPIKVLREEVRYTYICKACGGTSHKVQELEHENF